MKIHEYQAKQLLRQYSISVPDGFVINDSSMVHQLIEQSSINTDKYVVKAQVYAGGRGKGGGIKIANNKEEVEIYTKQLLNTFLVTPQTDATGEKINKLLIEEGVNIQKEIYFSILIDRKSKKPIILASREGGMDIEEVASQHPEKLIKEPIDYLLGLQKFQAQRIAYALNLHAIDTSLIRKASELFIKLYNVFIEKDASLIEINPLIITANNELKVLDCKMTFDDNALYRQPDIQKLIIPAEQDQDELEAAKYELSFIKLDGNIGCMVNGAGLAMATMDIVKYYGASPSNFLDVGGNTTEEKVAIAFQIICRNENVRCIFINIFGGIVRCDLIAKGIINALSKVNVHVPIVLRLEGTNDEMAIKIIKNSSFCEKIFLVKGFGAAAKKAADTVS